MEECKVRARAEGLKFQGETLEYIVTNQDMLELKPRIMIPTLHDYWVHDVEVIRNRWLYEAYPHNPYETVINTRPPISYYNDNNPDWTNIMIFYHVLTHIHLFQNNVFFRNTWQGDFCGEALADKRLLNRIREELGAEKRWVDYIIEFARGVDNLVGYYQELEENDRDQTHNIFGSFSRRVNFYFGEFLRSQHEGKTVTTRFYHEELERYNACQKKFGQKQGEAIFFDNADLKSKFPEFNNVFKRREEKSGFKSKDILQHLMEHSEFINKEENKWMKDVLGVVRRTSLYFQGQIRTKGLHESFSSMMHERLYITDPRISSHEVDFAKINSGVVFDPRVGLNPYITCKHILEFIEELAKKGRLSREYQMLREIEARKSFDQKSGEDAGKETLFWAVNNFDDFMLVNFLSDDDFQDVVSRHNLFVAGRRLNPDKRTLEVYIKSRNGNEYRKMLNDSLYHPPYILISEEKSEEDGLYLDHIFEGRTLVTKYIPPVLAGLAYLAGQSVALETTEFEFKKDEPHTLLMLMDPEYRPEYKKLRVLYSCKGQGQEVERTVISDEEGEE